MNESRVKYKKAALLLTEFLEDIVSDTPNVYEFENEMTLNLEKIKGTPIQ